MTSKYLLVGLLFIAAPGIAADAWVPARMPDGQPDLQGTWTNRTITSFERPAALADKATFTAEEVAAKKAAAQDKEAQEETEIWKIRTTGDLIVTAQTSLVIDPPDGRVPVRPEALALRNRRGAGVTNHWDNIAAWGRCISLGVPGGMLPHGFATEAVQILQRPDTVIIVQEKIHDVRIIPLDGRPHVGENIRLWMGDSRGRWDGDTLVVETTNFNDRGQVASAPAAQRLINTPVSEELHVVERFTRMDENTLQWQVTVTDPVMYTAPWTLSMPLRRNDDYLLYEYGCHEGNQSVRNMLATGRDRDAAESHPWLAALLNGDSRPKMDRARDAGRKPLQVLDYLGIGPGQDVLDIMAGSGWYTEVLSHAVGPDGTVVAQNPAWILTMFDGANDKALDERLAENRLPNVTRLNDNFGNIGPDDGMYDAAFSALNFHDVYYKFGEEITTEFMSAVYAILKPGGVFAVIDHAGTGGLNNDELHRIDKSIAIRFARAAGFIVEENNRLLANPTDDHSMMVFERSMRGKTNRFILKLRKPAIVLFDDKDEVIKVGP